MASRRVLNVATGIIVKSESIINGLVHDPRVMEMLIGKRSANSSNAGFWEHFGGKIDDTDADAEAAFARELREELGKSFQFEIKKYLFNTQYTPEDESKPILSMEVFLAHHLGGHVQLVPREHQDCGWVKPEDLEFMLDLKMFSPADDPIVEYILRNKWSINDDLR